MNGKSHDAAPWWVVILDIVAINLSMWLAYVLRYRLQWFLNTVFDAPYSAYLYLNIWFSLMTPLVLLLSQAYHHWRGRLWMEHISAIVSAVTVALVLSLAASFAFRPLVYSRLLLLECAIFMVVLMSLDRAAAMLIQRHLRRRGIGVRRIVIVGAGEVGRRVMRTVVARPDLGYQIVGYVDDNPNKGEGEVGRFKGLGPLDNLPQVIDAEAVDEVIVTLPWTYHRRIMQVLRECARRHVAARLVPDLFQISMSHVEVSDLGGVPLIEVHEIEFNRTEVIIKRVIDLGCVCLGTTLGAPLFALIALAIKLDSPGPILYKQVRVGKNGQLFSVYKFRSMRVGAEAELESLRALNEADGPLFKIKDDPRRTRVGSFLRKSSLDELPQLINIARGEMSMVGPRPPIPDEVAQYKPWHKRRLAVTPGLTGLWQVSGRSELTFDEMVLLDLYYIEHWSPWLDMGIILRTIPKVLLGQGAY
jgi:exopolysaccharide biosynthesis polyprenyl glycosylphosphotransferase